MVKIFLTLIFSWSLATYAEDMIKLDIKIGHGQVKIEGQVAPELKALLENVERDILIDESLANVLMSNDLKNVRINISTSDLKQPENITFNIIKDRIHRQIPEDKKDDLIISDGDKKVVMGSHLEVKANENLKELVVVGGSVDIKGTVEKLTVIGGTAHLFSSARITHELNAIGGYVQTDQGAFVHGRQNDIGVPLSEHQWDWFFDKIKTLPAVSWLFSGWFQLTYIIFKILVLMFFAYLGYLIAPNYQNNVRALLSSSFYPCILWGLGSTLLVLPVTIFFTLTVIGIPLLPLQFSFLFLFILFGYIHVSYFLIQKLSERFTFLKRLNYWMFLALGFLALHFIGQIPMVGWFIKTAIVLAGFGAASKVFYAQIFKNKTLSIQH